MWSHFEQSTVEDETISNNFSARGIFKIRSKDEISQYPNVQAVLQQKRMVIALDKDIVVLEDEMIAECSSISFPSMIDVITISSSGNLIICGLRDGEIHGIFIKGIPLFSVNINLEDQQINPDNGKTFIAVQEINGRFYVTCTNGSVYCLSYIDETPLEKHLNVAEDIKYNVDDNIILEPVTIGRVSTNRGLKDISTALLLPDVDPYSNEHLLIVGIRNEIFFRSTKSGDSRIQLPAQYGDVKCIYNLDNFIMMLTHSGHLLEVCPYTRLIDGPCNYQMSKTDTVLIDEMIVLENSDENIELLILSKAEQRDDDERSMKIIEFPSFRCVNELKVPKHAWLMQQPKCSVNLYYLCGHDLNVHNIPTAVEMMLLSETDPIDRFRKLIAKGHLEEAEEFGKQFELGLQPIYEAKTKRILLDITTFGENNPEMIDERFNEMLHSLGQIENEKFFCSIRMQVMPTRDLQEKYLRAMVKHIVSADHKNEVLDIEEQLLRLGTLTLIDPYDCDVDWKKFVYESNFVKFIIGLFKSNILLASLIWKRHSSALMPHLDDKGLCKLLNKIPNNTEPFNLVQWLRQFVPTICNTHPNVMPNISEWIAEKTRALQYSPHWPEIGLEFLSKVLEIFDDIEYIYSDIRRQHERNIENMRTLNNALEELVVLKKSYNLVITLDKYLQAALDETAIYILERVHLKNLKSLVNDFLYSIYQEKGATPIAALKRYVSMLISSRNVLSAWLERAVVCTELLHSEDDRLECALSVLRSASVPWPEIVTPLVRLRHSTHPLAEKINSEYEFQVIKIMKVKYGWPADSSADINLNLFMQRIIKLDLPEMLHDIRTLTKAAPNIALSANFNCCYQLVRRGKADVAYQFFKTLHEENTSSQTSDIIELFADVLESSALVPGEADEQQIDEQRQLIAFFKLISSHLNQTTCKRVDLIEKRFVLQQKFKLHVPNVQQMIGREHLLQLLSQGIENIIERCPTTNTGGAGITQFINSEINALCTALTLPRLHGIWRIAQRMQCLPLTCALTYAILETIASGTNAIKENRDDIIELALELIAQQIEAMSSKQNSDIIRALPTDDEDSLALLLAYELLVRVYVIEQKEPVALMKLLKYLKVAKSVYATTAIEDFYGDNKRHAFINENIGKMLEELKCTQSLNNSLNGDSSFEIKPQLPMEKKRNSMSVFDNFEMDQQMQQTNGNSCIGEQLPVVRFIARTLLVLIVNGGIDEHNIYFEKMRQRLPQPMQTDVGGANDDFYQSLEQLYKSKKYCIWYTIAQYLHVAHQQQEQQSNSAIAIIKPEYISQKLCRIFRSALNQRDINFTQLFVMLMADDQRTALLQAISSELRSDQQKINFFLLLEMYNIHMKNGSAVDELRTKRIKHFYYMDFCKHDPSIRGKFNASSDGVEQLLKQFHHKKLDIQLLQRMSRDFNLNYQQLLITQLVNTLIAQELQYEIKTDNYGEEILSVTSSVDAIRELCQTYQNEITNTDLLGAKLMYIMQENLNIYFYEVYLYVIEVLTFINAAPKEMQIWSSILQFLKHKMVTRRRSRPGQLETDSWVQSQNELSVLPKIARYRLPFKPIVEQPLKDILNSELNVDNCESWFPLIKLHTMLKDPLDGDKMFDYFCMAAVKNSIAEYKSSNDSEIWHLQPTNNAFLKSIQRLIRHMQNPSKAFSTLQHVASYAPDGADQVEAFYECVKYAKMHETYLTDPQYKEKVVRTRRKYKTLKTQHLLYIYGLVDEDLMALVENPMKLISKLYHHEIILQPSNKLDINALVREIAELHGLDIEAIQLQLLQNWLSVTLDCPDNTMCDETFIEDQAGSALSHDNGTAEENVLRAHYIFNSWPKEEAVKFIVAHMFNTDSAVNSSKKLRLCECLVKLNDGSNAFNNILGQDHYISIKCVHELKKLGYNTTIEQFTNCNKIQLLTSIWKRNEKTPQALIILANICFGHNIYLAKVWNGILKGMTMMNMINELSGLVDTLSCHAELLQIDGLAAAWECVLLQPFKSANLTRSFEQEDLLHKSLFRLQSCPVLHRLKLMEFVKYCIQLERPYMAAVFIALTKDAPTKQQIKNLICNSKQMPVNDALRKEILTLEDAGILPVIINSALKELNL